MQTFACASRIAVRQWESSCNIRGTMTVPLRRRVVLAMLILAASSAFGQVKYQLVLPEVVQQRLDLYRGDDTPREDSLVNLFTQAGCSAANLSEQPVPHRKQPNVICVLRGSSPDIV